MRGNGHVPAHSWFNGDDFQSSISRWLRPAGAQHTQNIIRRDCTRRSPIIIKRRRVCVCIYTGFYMPACYFLINRRSESHPSYSLRFLHRYPYPFHFFLFFILLLIYTCSFFLLYNIYYIRRKCYADALVLFPFCLPFLLVVVITVPWLDVLLIVGLSRDWFLLFFLLTIYWI